MRLLDLGAGDDQILFFRAFEQVVEVVAGVDHLGLRLAQRRLCLRDLVQPLHAPRFGHRLDGLPDLRLGDFVVDGGLLQLLRLREHAGIRLVLDLVVGLLCLAQRDFGLAQLRLVDHLLRVRRAGEEVAVAGLRAGERGLGAGHAGLRHLHRRLGRGHVHGIGRRLELGKLRGRYLSGDARIGQRQR